MARAKKSKSKFLQFFKTFWGKFVCSFAATVLVLGGVAAGFYGYIFGELDVEKDLTEDETGIVKQDYHVNTDMNFTSSWCMLFLLCC